MCARARTLCLRLRRGEVCVRFGVCVCVCGLTCPSFSFCLWTRGGGGGVTQCACVGWKW